MKSTRLHNFKVHYQNKGEYHSLKREIFTQGIYEPSLELRTSDLMILDIGAHIGLSTLYFKWLYPTSKIIAIEPNPDSFKILEQNIFENDLPARNAFGIANAGGEDINLYNLALDLQAGETSLHVDEADQWHSNSSLLENSWTGEEKTKAINIKTQTLSYFTDLISQQPDSLALLKMDIEGSESEILFSAGNKLKVFSELIIEFHPTGKQNINKLIKYLESLDFRIKLEKKNKEIKDQYHRGLIMIRASK